TPLDDPTTTPKIPKIINLSKRQLNTIEIKILSKGLKFTPTPQYPNPIETREDILEFCRKLRTTEELFDKTTEDNSIIYNKSNYTPNKGRNPTLDRFCDYISDFPYQHLPQPTPKPNTNTKEWQTIRTLNQDLNITIKEADKGSTVVIMDTPKYISSALTLLNDTSHYEATPNYKSSTIMNKLSKLIMKYRSHLTKKERQYLTNFTCRTSNFYGLPKLHKSQQINEKCKNSTSSYISLPHPDNLKLRPIVAGPSCETHRLSNFLDILLKPFLKHIPSLIQDNIEFLNKLPININTNTLLVSFDVVNLYTNIPHEYGLEAIQYWLNHSPTTLHERMNQDFIIEGLKFILQNNYFGFNNTTYRQTSGTAMGTKAAPTYANLVMGYLEKQIYEKSKNKFGNHFHNFLLTNWLR
ncbi:uncharacterized protein LOC115215981, partial [Argonauta hians]